MKDEHRGRCRQHQCVALAKYGCLCQGKFHGHHQNFLFNFLGLSCFIIISTLKQGDELNFSSSTFLVSAQKVFTLGFFIPPEGSSDDSFLGIWYSSNPNHPVWVANRDKPIANNSGVLTIDSTGTFVIRHDGGVLMELYQGPNSTNSTIATLLDTGNLVVTEEVNNNNGSNKRVWESFDYPTDTLLPGMKLGVNHRTGLNWSLTAWFSQGIPSPGAFTMDWDPNTGQLIVRRRGLIYWTSGALLGDKDFEFIKTDGNSNFNYNFSYVTTKDEEYFTYSSLVNDQKVVSGRGWLLNYLGNVYDGGDRDKYVIAQVDQCYGFSSDGGGCQVWEKPKCRTRYQRFENRSGGFNDVDGPQPARSDYNKSLGLSDCRAMCWNNSNCTGFKGDYAPGCLFWTSKKEFQQDNTGATVPFFVLMSEQPPPESPRKRWIWILIVVAVAFVVVVFSLLCFLRRRRNIRLQGEDDLNELVAPIGYVDTNHEVENDENKVNNLQVFNFDEIVVATNSFSSENKLGEGGFGPVYKGKLIDGCEIAVKQLSRRSGQGVVEFKNEIMLIAKLQHVNLVRLLGCCLKGNEKMLIYEYMLNKSLDFFLFDPIQKEQLTWEKRLNIIQGIAQGLLYLHKYSRLKIIHRDMKVSNILLDENMNPKISDFGMARIFKQNVLEANTERVVGTYGYMAPEYAMEGIFSVKTDVYSFGVLMLEIVSGPKNNSFHHLSGPLNLVGYVWELWNKNAALEIMDPILRDSCVSQQLMRCIHLSLLCVEDRAVDRPTMSDVISMLNNGNIVLPLPKKPAFVSRSDVVEEDLQQRKSEKYSINGVSFTAMDGR